MVVSWSCSGQVKSWPDHTHVRVRSLSWNGHVMLMSWSSYGHVMLSHSQVMVIYEVGSVVVNCHTRTKSMGVISGRQSVHQHMTIQNLGYAVHRVRVLRWTSRCDFQTRVDNPRLTNILSWLWFCRAVCTCKKHQKNLVVVVVEVVKCEL